MSRQRGGDTNRLRRIGAIAIALLIASLSFGAAPALAGKGGGSVNIIRLGSASDVSPSLNGP